MTVLRTRGVESEAPLPFAALHRLLRPVLGRLAAIPTPQANALRAAFGESEEAVGDRTQSTAVGVTTTAEGCVFSVASCVVL